MYRLLSLRKIKMCQLNGATLHAREMRMGSRPLERTCTLCKQTSNSTARSIRNQSTTYYSNTNPDMKPPRKKRLRGVKKYAELLIVGENSASQQKAKVTKLSSKDLNFFTTTNLNLNELYKIKDMMRIDRTFGEHTYNNLTVIENMPVLVETSTNLPSVEETAESVISPNSISIESDSDVLNNSNSYKSDCESSSDGTMTKFTQTNILEELEPFQEIIPAANAFQPEEVSEEEPHEVPEVDDVKTETRAKNEELKKKHEMLVKQAVVSKTLAAYLEIWSVLNNPHRGLNALWAYKHKCLNTSCNLPITQVNVYNAALKSFAREGKFAKVAEIVKYAKSVGVKFDVQSYAAIFECLGRCNVQNNHMREIRIYVRDAKVNDISFDKILNEAIFHDDEREYVLKAMQAHDKNYIPNYAPPDVQYDNSLLNGLNSEKQLRYESKDVGETTGVFTQAKMKEMIEEQMKIETDGYVTVKNIENDIEPTADILKYRKAFSEHVKMWEKIGVEAINRDLTSIQSKKQMSKFEPYLKSIPVEDFISIMVDEATLIAQGSETYSPTVNQLYRQLGVKVYSRFKVLQKKKTGVLDKILKIHSDYCKDYVATHPELDILPSECNYLNTRQKWQWIEFREKSKGASISLHHEPWVPTVLQGIGKFLYNIIMHDFKIDVNVMKNNKNKNYVPAFYTIFRHQGRLIKEEVKPHPTLFRLYRASAPETLKFVCSQVPMRCPPVPWSSLNAGGYLVTSTDFVRLPPQAVSQKQRLQETPVQQLYPSFDALNQLGAVPWKVNDRIFECITKVFIKGGSSKLSVPEHPSTLPPPVPPSTEMDKREKTLFFRQKLQHRRKKAELYSLWCDCLYRLSLANHFKGEIFWLPHNMDFRGRVYPVPPHLNHLGSDLARSMLIFAEGRPLGPKGLDWLKIHLVNLTGLKKRDSIEERLEYANEIMDKILDSADNPLDGQMWWAGSDEPWQTLACCMEIATASRSPDPEKFVSHFPVHQDGSCNGLQHYAALGRDAAGGHSVNLTPASKPQDVYSAVAVLVEEKRQRDAANGVEIAKVLEGFVRRKVIKQTVMTTVYGVTRYGARLQIARQLKDIDEYPKEHVWLGSSYLTSRTFESLTSMFTSTREIQDWFTDCARLISTVCGENVEWITPLGLPIVQPYFKYKSYSSNSFYETFLMDKFEKPNVMKQKNAFPPNFIHSLDSTHMMLTSLHCERAGITFVSVHDCYWTHPSTVNIMNQICREQFVALHSEPILENLSLFLQEKYSYKPEDFKGDGSVGDSSKKRLNKVLLRLPKTGDFNIEQVLESIYFFS